LIASSAASSLCTFRCSLRNFIEQHCVCRFVAHRVNVGAPTSHEQKKSGLESSSILNQINSPSHGGGIRTVIALILGHFV
jgi:hypothetical protein